MDKKYIKDYIARRTAQELKDGFVVNLGVGLPTLRDIVAELEKPGRDPRDGAPEVVFSKGIRSFDDLAPGMELSPPNTAAEKDLMPGIQPM